MIADPADWLPELIRDKWDLAVQSLADNDAVTFPLVPQPLVAAVSDPRAKAVPLRNRLLVKVYEAGESPLAQHSWGLKRGDETATWAIDLQTAKHDAAREVMHAARIIVGRVLEMHRFDPHEDWDRIMRWRARQVENYWDYQQVVFTIELVAYHRVLVTSIVDVV